MYLALPVANSHRVENLRLSLVPSPGFHISRPKASWNLRFSGLAVSDPNMPGC